VGPSFKDEIQSISFKDPVRTVQSKISISVTTRQALYLYNIEAVRATIVAVKK
jgi:hypothetical protein